MKYVLRKVLSLLQGHYLLESDDGITINRYIGAVSGPGRDIHVHVYQYCSVLCLNSRAGVVTSSCCTTHHSLRLPSSLTPVW